MSRTQQVFGTRHPVALVTGAGAPRVGNGVARELAARGYRVALHANRSLDAAQATAEELRQQGCEAIAVRAEMTDEASLTTMIGEVHSRFGRIDALVNSAAIWSPISLKDVTAADVRRNFEVNTLGTFVCCQQVGLLMAQQATGGAIVNFGDWAPVRPYVDYAAYFPSKGAIPTLTRSLAVELAAMNRRIRVNAVLPGPVLLAADAPDEKRDEAMESTLLKRVGTPRHVADAVILLLENDFITGVCLPVDGGRSIYAPENSAS
jgi:pteridine reductase